MKDIVLVFVFLILLIGILLGATWIGTGNDFFLYKYFGPKQEAVRREIFENSKAYNQGMIQQLERQRIEYAKGDDSVKEAITSMILHDFADYDDSKLPSDLYQFMQKIKNQPIKVEKSY